MARLSFGRTYRPTKDGKDPLIFKIKTLLQDEGLMNRLDTVAEISNVARSTLGGWFDGDTISPIGRTVGNVITSIGYDIEIVKRKDIDIEKELKAAAAWLLKQNDAPKRRSRKKANGHHK